jgi:hypothetical protein
MTKLGTISLIAMLLTAFGLAGCDEAENAAESAADEVKNIADDAMDAAEGAADAVDRQF